MSILHPNEKFARKMSREIAEMVGVPSDLVRTIIDMQSYYILNEIANEGRTMRENGERKKVKIQIPNIGTLELNPAKYPKTEDSILDGWALRSKFVIREPYLAQARQAYYTGEDYMTPYIQDKFNKFIVDKYMKVIRDEEE